jgi:hypothetical protein
MSMWVSLKRISRENLAKVRADKELLRGFMRHDKATLKALGISPKDESWYGGFDYHCLGQDHEEWTRAARQDALNQGLDPDELVDSTNPFTREPMKIRRYQRFPTREPELRRDMGCAGELDYMATYGPAYFIEPDSVAKLLARQPHLADDPDAGEMIRGAVASGDYLVCAVT